MKRFQILFTLAFVALAVCFWSSSSSAQAGRPLSDVLEDWQGYTWSDIQDTASWQAQNDGPLYPSAPSSTPAYETFEGSFTPSSADTKLAIFSDDGCDVYINGSKVFGAKGRGQALPNLSQSLAKIDYSFQAGQTYQIRVEYSNTAYLGAADIDGASLFAYSESGTTTQQSILKLQHKINADGNWVDSPTEEAISVPEGAFVYFRAVKSIPGQDWFGDGPTWGGDKLVNVSHDAASSGKVALFRYDEPAPSEEEPYTVTARNETHTAEAKVEVQLRDKITLSTEFSSRLGGGSSPLSQTNVTAVVVDSQGNPVPNKEVQFSTSTGSVSSSSATTDSEGVASVVFTAGSYLGVAEVTAEANFGEAIVDATTEIQIEPPVATLQFIPDSGDNPRRSLCLIIVSYQGQNLPDRAIRVTSTAYHEEERTSQVVGTESYVSTSTPSGMTDQVGAFQTYINWQPENLPPNYHIFVDVYDEETQEQMETD